MSLVTRRTAYIMNTVKKREKKILILNSNIHFKSNGKDMSIA